MNVMVNETDMSDGISTLYLIVINNMTDMKLMVSVLYI
jgi:hypothetical protein